MPKPGEMVGLSPQYTPAYLKGIIIHPENALKFDFIIYKGDKPLSEAEKYKEYGKLIKYFMASLAVPDQDQWVNLSPYEKDRIINGDFGRTEMGRDLLAQDYLLKQVTSSLIYPDGETGRKFWGRVYAQAQKLYGTSNIPVNTFNKVWILPDKAVIYERGNTAVVLKSHLRVMLQEDYLALEKGYRQSLNLSGPPLNNYAPGSRSLGGSTSLRENVASVGSNIVREIVLPELEKEINQDQHFAPVRQVYSGMLLAAWYKRALKESLLSRIYANKAKLQGLDPDPLSNELIYQRYLQAYKKGVFNFIKEDKDRYTHQSIPRKYFSGGVLGFDPTAGVDFTKVVQRVSMIGPHERSNLEKQILNFDLAQMVAKEPGEGMISKALRRKMLAGLALALFAGIIWGGPKLYGGHTKQNDQNLPSGLDDLIVKKAFGTVGPIGKAEKWDLSYFSMPKERPVDDLKNASLSIALFVRGVENAPILMSSLEKILVGIASGVIYQYDENALVEYILKFADIKSNPNAKDDIQELQRMFHMLLVTAYYVPFEELNKDSPQTIEWYNKPGAVRIAELARLLYTRNASIFLDPKKPQVLYDVLKSPFVSNEVDLIIRDALEPQGDLHVVNKKGPDKRLIATRPGFLPSRAIKKTPKPKTPVVIPGISQVSKPMELHVNINHLYEVVHFPEVEEGVLNQSFRRNRAQLAIKDLGGIDFNAAHLNLQIKRDGRGIALPVAQQDLENIDIEGLVPVILSIVPAQASSDFLH